MASFLYIYLMIWVYIRNAQGQNYPINAQYVVKEYRKLTIKWDLPLAHVPVTDEKYAIKYIIQNAPSYLKSASGIQFLPKPEITFDNLLLVTTLSIRVGIQTGPTANVKYSPFQNFTTESVKDVGKLTLPEQVTEIKLDTSNRDQKILWRAPANILTSSNPQVKSIQYRIEQCNHNPIRKYDTNCKIIGEVIGEDFAIQSSKNLQDSIFAFGLNLPTNRDLLIRITPVALNLQKGEINSLVVNRLDQSSKPKAPSNLHVIAATSHSVDLEWDEAEVKDASYVYELIYPNETKIMEDLATNQLFLRHLNKDESYKIRVAIDDSERGASEFSEWLSVIPDQSQSVTTKSPTSTKSPASSTNSGGDGADGKDKGNGNGNFALELRFSSALLTLVVLVIFWSILI